MKRLVFNACIVGLAVILSGPAVIAESQPPAAEVIAGAGVINVLDNTDRRLVESLDVRFAPVKWWIQPWVGAMYAEEQTYLVSAGIVLAKQTESGLRFAVGWAPSYYHAGGGKALGDALEFYSFGEIGWRFRNRDVISLRFGHISNGGLRRHNPGTEIMELSYSLPLDW